MIGLVLVTHGRLAVEFRSALEHVVGPQRQIEAVTIGPDDDVEQRRKDIIEAVKRCRGRAQTEISGGVTLGRIAELATTGADYVSVGALTHSAPAADLSFEIEPE